MQIPVYLFHDGKRQFNREEFEHAVANVERRVKHQIPANGQRLGDTNNGRWQSVGRRYQTAEAITSCWLFLSGARGGSPRRAALSTPPANTTNIVDSQHEMGCLRENARAPKQHIATLAWTYFGERADNGSPRVTWTQVVAHVQRTQYAVRDVEVRVHLPFGHLAGKLQKRFGVHFPGAAASTRNGERDERTSTVPGTWVCKKERRF